MAEPPSPDRAVSPEWISRSVVRVRAFVPEEVDYSSAESGTTQSGCVIAEDPTAAADACQETIVPPEADASHIQENAQAPDSVCAAARNSSLLGHPPARPVLPFSVP